MHFPDCARVESGLQEQIPWSQWVSLSKRRHCMSSWHIPPTPEPGTHLVSQEDVMSCVTLSCPNLSSRRRGLLWGQWHSPVNRSHSLSFNFVWWDLWCHLHSHMNCQSTYLTLALVPMNLHIWFLILWKSSIRTELDLTRAGSEETWLNLEFTCRSWLQ